MSKPVFPAWPRPSIRRSLGFGLVAGSLIVWSGAGFAGPPPESFSGLAKKVTPAVVNVISTAEVSGAETEVPELPFEFPEGSPFEKFFKQFRDRMGEGEHGRGEPRLATGLGSGFIVDAAGYIVTNNHVVKEAKDVKVRLDDESVYPAKIIGTDPQTDLALLKIDADRPLTAVQFGDSDKAEVGDWVLAVGNPFGLGGTVTAGIISARGRNIDAGPYDDFLQIDAPINKGNSGGPLFGLDGRVIGVNTAIYSPNGGSVGIGFAIPSNMAKTVIAQLRETGRVERGWLGVRIQNVTPDIASAIGIGEAKGAMVVDVTAGSPAAKAGLRQGDVILGFGASDVGGSRELARLVGSRPAGSTVEVRVWRDRAEKRLSVVTGEQPVQLSVGATEPEGGAAGAYHSQALNAELAALTPKRRAELNVAPEVTGVAVVDVKMGPAYEQGLRAGDVIRQVAGTPVSEPRQVESLVEKAKSKAEKAVLLLVNRQGQDLFIGLKLGVA